MRDVTTGADGNQQVYRFQAVLVHGLLLGVGVVYVIQYLAYPSFDTSWLQFLGLSGITQTAGKQIVENKSPPTQVQR